MYILGVDMKSELLYSKCAPSPIIHFSHLSGGDFVNTMPVKIFPFCREPLVESFFHIFVQTEALPRKCVTHRCKQVIIGRSQVW